MALHPLRLRRALSLSFSLLNRSLQGPKPVSCGLLSTPLPTHTVTATPFSIPWTPRFFTSTNALSRKIFDPATDEIGPDTILLEGCDFNHWLITMDFPKDSNITHDQMIETYVNTAAQIFGSVEEAKKKIYALSTTTYQGFQVLCSEETSEKFKDLPGVVFVLPDSYIDAVNKEYGGDKYVNGEVVPRPNPVYFGRKSYRERRPTEQNFESPPQQNYGPGPRPQQNYVPDPRPQQNYVPDPRPQQNYGPGPRPQQNYEPQPPQNYGQSPQQNYSPPQQSNVPWPQQSYGQTATPQSFGQNVPQNYAPQNYGRSPHQNYSPPQQSNVPWPQQSYGQTPTPQSSGQNVPQNYAPQNYGQSPQQNYSPPQQSNVPWPQQSYGQTPTPQSFGQDVPQNYGNSSNFPPQQNFSPTGSREGNPLPSYRGTFNQPEPMNQYGQGQRNSQSHEPLEQRGPLLQIFTRWTF